MCNFTFWKERRKEIAVASIYIELLLRKELLILYLEIEPTLAQIFQPSILWSFMENPAPLYAIFFGKKRNSNYRLRLMQAFARKEVSNYWFCVLKSSRFSPKFFNPRRCHRDLALIPCPCVCNFTFGKKKKEGNSSPCFHLVQAFARKELLILYLEIKAILCTNFSTLDIVIVTLLLWRIPCLYKQFHLWKKKEIAIIVSILYKLLLILCLEIEPKFFNPRCRHRDLALISRPCVCNLTFGKERRKEIAVASIYIELLHERNYWFCISKSSRSSHKFFNPRHCNRDFAFMENPVSL